jgi:hypothetical protein
MFGLETLDVLIGLITVYLVFSMACTAIVEAIMLWCDVRSSNLEAALNEFLNGNLKDGKPFVKAFYDHPLVQMLSKGIGGRPSYIPPEIVGQVVEALITANGTVTLADSIASLPGTPQDNRIKGLLSVLSTQAKEDTAEFRKAVEAHFDATMDRASGWIKRYSHNITLAVSILLVVGANVDTVDLATSLASNPGERMKMVEIAQQQLNAANDHERKLVIEKAEEDSIKKAGEQSKLALETFNQAESSVKSAGLRLGWSDCPKDVAWLTKAVGLIVSILAVSLGAPFWFDILQRFMQIRTTGVSPRETKNKEKQQANKSSKAG